MIPLPQTTLVPNLVAYPAGMRFAGLPVYAATLSLRNVSLASGTNGIATVRPTATFRLINIIGWYRSSTAQDTDNLPFASPIPAANGQNPRVYLDTAGSLVMRNTTTITDLVITIYFTRST